MTVSVWGPESKLGTGGHWRPRRARSSRQLRSPCRARAASPVPLVPFQLGSQLPLRAISSSTQGCLLL